MNSSNPITDDGTWCDGEDSEYGGTDVKIIFAADVGHVRRRGLVVGSRSRVSGSEKGGEGRGRPSATRRGSGR